MIIIHKKSIYKFNLQGYIILCEVFQNRSANLEKVKKYDLNCLRFEYFNGSRDKAAQFVLMTMGYLAIMRQLLFIMVNRDLQLSNKCYNAMCYCHALGHIYCLL